MRVNTAWLYPSPHETWAKRLALVLAVLSMLLFMASTTVSASTVEACLVASGDWQDRIDVCSATIESGDLGDIELSMAYRERGRAHAEVGNDDAALQDLTESISLNPGNRESWVLRGQHYFNAGDLDRAQGDFLQALALRIRGSNFAALLGCIDVLKAKGLSDGEISFRDQCMEMVGPTRDAVAYESPNDTNQSTSGTAAQFGTEVTDLINRLGSYNVSGDWYRAADAYVRAHQIDPDAVLCLWQADWAIDGYALRQYDMLVRPDIYTDRALANILSDSHKALWEMSDDPTLLRERALLFAESGGMFQSVDDLDAALVLDPGSVELMVMSTKARIDVMTSGPLIYRFLDDVRRYLTVDLMLERIERAMELGADDFLTRLTYAEVLTVVLRDSDEHSAIEQQIAAYDRTLELLPTWPDHPAKWLLASEIYLARSGLWRNLGDEDRAMEDFDSAFLSPDDSKRRWDELCHQP